MKRDYQQMTKLLNSTKGKYASVLFTKKDGSLRLMNIQPAKTKNHVKGDKASEQAKRAVKTRAENNPNLYNCWDVTKKAIRSINLDTVQEIKISGRIFTFD